MTRWEEGQSEVPLSGILQEFRTALREEIEAARRNEASSAIPLINGRKIAQVGGSFQYAFEVENILNLPGDAPGDLTVPGLQPQEVSVVSVDGMTITLAVPNDLGQHVPTARLQSNLTFLMRKLIQRIEAMPGRANPVGDRIIGDSLVQGAPVRVDAHDLSRDQEAAVASCIGRNTTFIWGPPGTGKTETIGAVGRQLHALGRPLLLVSHTNSAVDQAVLKIAKSLAPEQMARGEILRVGAPKDARLLADEHKDLLLKTHVDGRSAELADRRRNFETQRIAAAEQVVQFSRLVDLAEWLAMAPADIEEMASRLAAVEEIGLRLLQVREEQESLVVKSGYWSSAEKAADFAASRLPKITELDNRILVAGQNLSVADRGLREAEQELRQAEALLAETMSVGWLVRKWRRLPDPEHQRSIVRRKQSSASTAQKDADLTRNVLTDLGTKRAAMQEVIARFKQKYAGEPESVLDQARDHQRRLTEVTMQADNLRKEEAHRRVEIEDLLSQRLAAVRQLGLCSEGTREASHMLQAIRSAVPAASSEVAGRDIVALRKERDRLNDRIGSLDAELKLIEEALKKVEELVIAEARVVATTLTSAYLRDCVQARRFDTVILDEASMAPIPALWIAASVAMNNAVVVGDFWQLPPIVISTNEMARKWLGRDVFEVAGLDATHDESGRRVDLLVQHRMHPHISRIPNQLIYAQRLRDSDGMEINGEASLVKWYRADWGHDAPVLLVDTGPVGAWVTSVSRGSRASRLNFLSATICVDLAEQMLRDDREPQTERAERRIMIVCPYRPHAKLLELLIREQDLSADVTAGTAHSFQGSQADVVILDLVNDEPHWKVGMFNPQQDESTRRLLNVAITRARRRLVVVGDFNYIAKQSKRAFLGGRLVPFLIDQFPRVDAHRVVPVGLSARAAKAQRTLTGGFVEADADRLVVTQERFYQLFVKDLAAAKRRVVIYSAFITQDRIGQLEPQLKAAVDGGVAIYVVTKSRDDRSKRELPTYRALEQTLTEWGAVIIHKRRMHEKLIFIDDSILWAGSLNPLSHSNTQETMERRKSPAVVADYARTVCLDELVGEYANGTPQCPICGSEVIASEGNEEPYYWKCVERDCYRRGIAEPPMMDGMVVCGNCGKPVEFGRWGNEGVWRCTANPRHRQRIARTHLRLPKMRALVPKRDLAQLDRLFAGAGDRSIRRRAAEAPTLFDLDQ